MILSKEVNSTNGKILLDFEGAETFALSYEACFWRTISIKVDDIEPEYLNSILDFIQPFILMAAPGMEDILESLNPHMAKKITHLDISDGNNTRVTAEILHYLDGTTMIDVHAYGE